MSENLIKFTKQIEYYYPRIFSFNPNHRTTSELTIEDFKPKDSKPVKKISENVTKNFQNI